MAKEKANIQELTVPEVEDKIREMKKEIFTLRFRNAMRQLDNPLRIRFLKRDVARYTTALAEHRQGIRSLATGEDMSQTAEAPAKPKAARKTVKKIAKKTVTKSAAKPAAKPAVKPAVKPATKAAPKKKEEAVAEAKTASATGTKSSEKPKRRVPWSRGKKKDKE
jgi:ribosomal protein L29